MKQAELWHDTIFDAVSAAVEAAGGFKRVATQVWPSLDSTSATARLRGCLNPEHAQKLCLSELVHIARLARDCGDNSVMRFLGRELGCEVTPLSAPEARKRARSDRAKALIGELTRLIQGDDP